MSKKEFDEDEKNMQKKIARRNVQVVDLKEREKGRQLTSYVGAFLKSTFMHLKEI